MTDDAVRSEPSAVRDWMIRLGLLAVSVLFALAMGEAITRLFVSESKWRFHDSNDDWQFDEELGWVQLPDLDVSRMHDGKIVRFRTNSDGVTPHTARRERTPGQARIILFGDSTVVGRWVPQDQTLNAHLERVLRARGIEAEVINAGIEGYATDQALLLMERLVPLYRPDVVAYGLHPNDFGGNVSREAYGNPKPMLEFGEDGELRVLPPIVRERRILPRGEVPVLRSAIQHSALYRLCQPFIVWIRASFAGWENELMHGIDQEQMYYRPGYLDRFDWRLLGGMLERMRDSSAASGARFFFYHHPDIGAVWDPYIQTFQEKVDVEPDRWDRHALENKLASVADAHGVRFMPVVDYFVANQSRGPFHLLPRDYHCNPTGYQMTAELIADQVIRTGLLPESPRSGSGPS